MHITIATGVQLFVDIEGAGLVPDGAQMREKPTLILLHGGPGDNHSSFKPLFSALADVAQMVYVGHRGHGRSSRVSPEQWTLDTFADDVVRLCSALGIHKPIVLGQRFGGFVAQRYINRHPAHPGKVCPLQDALDIAAALPARWLQLVRFANAGHGTWRDQPEAAMARLRQFITDPITAPA